MASPEPTCRERKADESPASDDDGTGANIDPIVKLEDSTFTTGEEDEDPLLDLKAKLYRFDKQGNQWKERGSGTVKLLKHKDNGKVRLLMRQSKTLKICANHHVLPSMTVQDHTGNEKSCLWHASDFADAELKEELFCIRFSSTENCKTFKDMFQEVAESQNPEPKKEEAAAAADAMKNLSVVDGEARVREPAEAAKEEDPKVDDVAPPEFSST